MKKAEFIKSLGGSWNGDARLYKLTPPLDGAEYVVVSAVVPFFSGPETYIFPSNKKGEVESWMEEMEGSFRGALDHVEALGNAGYEVV